MAKLFANSGDPDQMPHFVVSDLGLHCLPIALLGVSRLQKVKRLYLQNFWMEVVHPCPDVRYWSEILCCAIPTYMSDLEVRVMNLEKIMLQRFWLKLLEVYIF